MHQYCYSNLSAIYTKGLSKCICGTLLCWSEKFRITNRKYNYIQCENAAMFQLRQMLQKYVQKNRMTNTQILTKFSCNKINLSSNVITQEVLYFKCVTF